MHRRGTASKQQWSLNIFQPSLLQASEPSNGSAGTSDCSACAGYLAAFKVIGRVDGSSIMPLLPASGRFTPAQTNTPPPALPLSLLQDLAVMKVVLPTSQGMRDLCYSLAADYGSLTLEG